MTLANHQLRNASKLCWASTHVATVAVEVKTGAVTVVVVTVLAFHMVLVRVDVLVLCGIERTLEQKAVAALCCRATYKSKSTSLQSGLTGDDAAMTARGRRCERCMMCNFVLRGELKKREANILNITSVLMFEASQDMQRQRHMANNHGGAPCQHQANCCRSELFRRLRFQSGLLRRQRRGSRTHCIQLLPCGILM